MPKARSTFVWEPPEPDLELILARQIHSARSLLRETILDALAGRPQRYADLQPLLRGGNTNLLNRALRALSTEGLIDQYIDSGNPKASMYQLTSLGVAVRDAIVELRFAERVRSHSARTPEASSA